MRDDIDRVIIDCYRHGGRVKYPRKAKRYVSRDIEEAPKKESIQIRHSYWPKLPGDKLGAIKGFLKKNVGRPWNKVYSEIRQHLSHNSMSQSHVLDHIDQYVEIHTKMDGKKVVKSDGTKLWYFNDFYVHPVNGLLCENKENFRKYKRPKQTPIIWNNNRTAQYHKIDDIWYEIQVKPIPKDGSLVFDVVLNSLVNLKERKSFNGKTTYYEKQRSFIYDRNNEEPINYSGHYYACNKKQLGKREIKKLNLK